MILPNKYISEKESLLGLGGAILQAMNKPNTITALWEKSRTIPEVGSFERFLLALDFLYLIGAIELDEGLLRRCN